MTHDPSNEEAASPRQSESRPLFVVKGEPTAEEVAALVTVLQAVAAAAPPSTPTKRRSEWAAPHRKVRSGYLLGAASGAGGWRSSSLPR